VKLYYEIIELYKDKTMQERMFLYQELTKFLKNLEKKYRTEKCREYFVWHLVTGNTLPKGFVNVFDFECEDSIFEFIKKLKRKKFELMILENG